MSSKTLLIGYGSPLRCDDGLGPLIVRRLLKEDDLQIEGIIAHQLLPEMAEKISRAGRLILIDASAEKPAGDITIREIQPIDLHEEWLMHDFTPQQIVTYARHLYGIAPPTTLITVNGFSFQYSEQLSPQMQALLPQIMAEVRSLIEKTG